LGSGVWGLGLRVWGSGIEIWSLWFGPGVLGSGFGVWGLGLWFDGLQTRDGPHTPRHSRKVDVRLPGHDNLNTHGARPVHLIITTIKWIRNSVLSIKDSLSTTSPIASFTR